MSQEDLADIVRDMVESTLPKPVINIGNGIVILIPTLFIVEPYRLRMLCSGIQSGIDGGRSSYLAMAAQNCFEMHKSMGEANLDAPIGKGCASLFVVLLLVVSVGGYLIHKAV